MPDWLCWWRKYLQAIREAQSRAQEHASQQMLRRWRPEIERDRKFTVDGLANDVRVDLVADYGRRWINEVSAKPFGLGSNNWTGQSSNGQRKKQGLRERTEKMLRAARVNKVLHRPPYVVVRFTRGVSRPIAEALLAMGAQVEGDIIEPPPRAQA